MTLRSVTYKRLIKPVLFHFSPDKAHACTIRTLSIAGRIPGFARTTRRVSVRRHPELEFEWSGMHFSSPVGLGAGLDKNGQIVNMMRSLGFGFTEVGSVTAEAFKGNARPWFYRLPQTQSLVVHVGLANHGIRRIIQRLEALPRTVQKKYPTILSVARTNSQHTAETKQGIADYVHSVAIAQQSAAVQMIEINISCPNAFGGETFTTPQLLDQLLIAIDEVSVTKPLLIKMPADLTWPQTKALLTVASTHAVTGITFANLTKNREVIDFKEPLPKEVQGGLSGVPTRELSTNLLHKTAQAYGDRFVLIGLGGVFSAKDAYDKITRGAQFVELVTSLIIEGPQVVEEINAGLVDLLRRDGFTHISEAIGSKVTKTSR